MSTVRSLMWLAESLKLKNRAKRVSFFIILVILASSLSGCAMIPIPNSIPVPNSIPIVGLFL